MNQEVPALASLLFAWAAVHTFVAAYALALFSRIRPSALYGGFATASAGGAIYAMGGAWLVMASDVAEAVIGQRAQMMGAGVILAGAIPALYTLAHRPGRTMARAAIAWGLIGVALALTQLPYDAAHPTTGPHSWTWPQAQLRPVGIAHVVVAAGIVGGGIADVCRRRGLAERDLRLTLIITTPAVLAWVIDVVRRIAELPPLFLFAHVSVVASVGVSYVLLGRFTRVDEELRERTRELRRSYDELQAAQEELVQTEQLAAVGELSAVIAHEVRHPLRVLERSVSALLGGELPRAEQARLLGNLDEQADRLNRLVHDLLAYARPMDPQQETVDLARLVRKSTTLPEGRAAEVHVDDCLDAELPPIQGDPGLLLRAFHHIVENALQAMPAGGRLVLTSSRTELADGRKAVVLSFRDTGEGMDQLVQERARDPFFTTRPSGTGLGLAIVERVAYAHGGTVKLQSSYGGGTTVTVTLPVDRISHPPLPTSGHGDVMASTHG